MAVKLVTQPSVEPVSLDEAKANIRVDDAFDDAAIERRIISAREEAENICRRAFITQTFELYLDSFPSLNNQNTVFGYMSEQISTYGVGTVRNYSVRFRGQRIDLPFPPLQFVDSIKYYDTLGTLQTLNAAAYLVDAISEPGCITPAPSMSWPDTQQRVNAVQIRFTAGYGNAADVPKNIKEWILMQVGALNENRESIAVGSRLVVVNLPFADRMLDRYKIASYV